MVQSPSLLLSTALSELKQSSGDAHDLWASCVKPKTGIIFQLMKDAKYKYKLAIRDAVRSYENKFSDELYEHLLSKDLNSFWKTWSAKTCKITSVSNINVRDWCASSCH